jgi:DNA-directed RNA polymerase specialized sigma subunit
MNFEQFKQHLEHGRKLPIKITNLEMKINEQRLKTTYKSNNYQAISGSSGNHFENSLDKLIRLEDKLDNYKLELQHHKDCLEKVIQMDTLTYSEKEVIKLRYLENYTWRDVSELMDWNYETNRCYQVNNSALRKIFSSKLYT